MEDFKKRQCARCLRVNGERASLPENYEELMRPVIQDLANKKYPLNRFYNWDETGLFYKALPNYTLAKPGDDGAGMKNDKSRISILAMVNGDGFYKEIILIGKSKTPRNTNRAFFESNRTKYYNNDSAWMTREIFEDILLDFDSKLTEPVVLLLDNFSAHNIQSSVILKNVIPIYLPPNTTSKSQPFDAGIIATFKVKYKAKLLKFIGGKMLHGISTLKILQFL